MWLHSNKNASIYHVLNNFYIIIFMIRKLQRTILLNLTAEITYTFYH